jgi:dCTP deaminase
MILRDFEITNRGNSLISPFDPMCVQPASYDLKLDKTILKPTSANAPVDLRYHDPKDFMESREIDDGYILYPGDSVLANTVEYLMVPSDMVARVEGKSSLGRLFLAVHVTAGFVDPGFKGQITLEIVNLGKWSVRLYPGMKIAQVNFHQMGGSCSVPYGSSALGSHYQGQTGPVASSGKRGDV